MMQARDTFVLLRHERVKTYTDQTSNDERQSSSHVEAAPMNELLSGSNDVIHSLSPSLSVRVCASVCLSLMSDSILRVRPKTKPLIYF